MLAGSHWGGVRRLTPIKKEVNMNENNYGLRVFQGSLLVEDARPEKGFFIKSKERCFSLRDNKWHSKFSWEPVVVSDLWVDEMDGKCQMHFRVQMADTTRFQVAHTRGLQSL